jgi:hypothetical protein
MLTVEQQATLKVFIETDPMFTNIPQNVEGAYQIALMLQEIVSPAFTVWKTSVEIDEIMRNGMDWTLVDNLSVGKARIWDWLGRLGTINPSKINVRAGIDAAWAGTGAAFVTLRANIYSHCKRPANHLEKLFSTGVGSDASPATMVVEVPVSYSEVQLIMGW